MQMDNSQHFRVHDKGFFWKVNSLFCTKTPCTTKLLTSTNFQQLMLSKKALYHALCCTFYSLWTLNCFIYIAAELLSLAGKNTHLIMAVSSENCNVRT